MTNEDNTADATRVSNWTLATGTKPGTREVYSPTTPVVMGLVGPKSLRPPPSTAGQRDAESAYETASLA